MKSPERKTSKVGERPSKQSPIDARVSEGPKELSESAQHAFFKALVNPPDPNEKMIVAAKRYQKS